MKLNLHLACILLCSFFIFNNNSFAQTTDSNIAINLNNSNSLREVVFPTSSQSSIELCGLIIGRDYNLFITQKYSDPTLFFEGTSPKKNLSFNATAICQTVFLLSDFLGNSQEALVFSVSCENCEEAIDDSPTMSAFAPIISFPSLDAANMVQNVFIGGDCFDTSNYSAAGDQLSIGTFFNATTSFGFDSGIILSCGYVSDAAGPSSAFRSTDTNGISGDSDLTALSGVASNDVAILEFDFVPTVDQVSFEYVFASEEYCDYSFSSFNDVFGFFLSGPGINGPFSNGSINIATLPDGSDVSINNVNQATNTNFFVSNGNGCGGPGFAPNDCGYNGYTATMTATANVIPCETYHIKLAIADGGDSVFDSAVFLKENSFDAGGVGVAEAIVPATGSSDGYETANCGDAFFTFSRQGGDSTIPVFIDYQASGSAINGVDYTGLPPSPIIIPPGLNSIQVPINIVIDNIQEGTETINLFLFGSCSCEAAEVSLNIHDAPIIDVTMDDVEVCSGFPAQVVAAPSGGIQPYLYDWGGGPSPINFSFDLPTETTNYTVTVTDACGTQGIATATADIFNLVGTLGGTASLCGTNSSDFLEITFEGTSGPYEIIYSIDNIDQPSVGGILTSPYMLEVNSEGTYALELVAVDGCIGQTQGTVLVSGSSTEYSSVIENATCAGTNTGSINLTVTNASGALSYAWSNGSTLEDQASLAAGNYTVTINDGGCEIVETFSLAANPPITGAVMDVVGVDCDNPTDGSISIDSGGGNGVLTYAWSNGETTEDITNLASGTYSVTITDIDDCEIVIDDIEVTGSTDVPTADIEQLGELNCITTEIMLEIGTSSTGADFSYEWADDNGIIVSGTDETGIIVDAEGTYTLTVINLINGCFAEAPVSISIDNEEPSADAGEEPSLTCTNTSVQLNGTASDNGDNITYSWVGPNDAIITDDDTNVPSVDLAGIYTLTVLNTDNGCSSTATVDVQEDLTLPIVEIVDPIDLDCSTSDQELDATASSDIGNFDYEWTTNGTGNIVSGTTLTPTIEGAGDYTLTIINNDNGCEDSATVSVVDVSAFPNIAIATASPITCNNMTSILDASASDSGNGLIYEWVALNGSGTLSDVNAITPTVDGAGTFELTITNPATDCTSELQIVVDENTSPPFIQIEDSSEISCDNPIISLDASNSETGTNITYAWSTNGSGTITNGDTNTPSINAPGNYELTITNTTTGCSAASNIEVVGDPETPIADIELDNNISCNQLGVNINGFGTSVGNNFTYSWDLDGTALPDENSFSITNTGIGGTYTLTVYNSNNDCEATAFVEVLVDTLVPTAVAASMDNLDCATLAVNLDGTSSDQGTEYSYAWSTNEGSFNSSIDTIISEVSSAGVYYLEVFNSLNGCSSLDSVVVESITTPPVINIENADALTCSAIEQTISSNVVSTQGNVSYVWTGAGIVSGANSANPVVNEGGIFSLVATDQDNGCTETADILIEDNRVYPTANAGLTDELNCNNPSLILDASASNGEGELIYSWTASVGVSVPVGQENLVNPEITQAGTYQIEITDTSNDCTSTAEVIITDDFAEPTANAGQDTPLNCGITSLILDGSGSSGGNVSYLWTASNGGIIEQGTETLQNPTITSAGTFEVLVTDMDNGCSATDVVTIAQDDNAPLLNIVSSGDLNCINEITALNATIDNVGANFDFSWSTAEGIGNIEMGEMTLAPTVDAPGTYILSVINNDNNCESEFSITVNEDVTVPTVSLSVANVIDCINDGTALITEGSDNGTNFDIVWTSSTSNIPNDTNPNPIVNEAGTYTLAITNTNNGCENSEEVTVLEDLVPPTAITNPTPDITCDYLVVPLSGLGSSTGTEFQYSWINNTTGEEVGTDLEMEIQEAGTYTLTVLNTNNGCSETAETVVGIDADFPDVEAGTAETLTCITEMTALNGNGSSEGANITYLWTVIDGTGNITDPTSLYPSIDAPGTYQIAVTNIENNCIAYDEVVVVQDIIEPTIEIATPNLITCLVDEVTLNATSSDGSTFEWTSQNGNDITNPDTPNPVVSSTGTYIVTVISDTNGCVGSSEIVVDENMDNPEVNVDNAFLISCESGNATLTATSSAINANYLWTNENGTEYTGVSVLVTEAGLYNLTVTNLDNECAGEAETNVESEFPTAFETVISDANCGSDFGAVSIFDIVGGTPGYLYSVDGGETFSQSSTFTQLSPGAYTALIQDLNGCEYEEEFSIEQDELLTLSLEESVLLKLGDSYDFLPLINKDEDILVSIEWTPNDSLTCSDCLYPSVIPQETTLYTLTLKDSLGCTATASTLLNVDRTADIYLPSGFSPDGDGINDLFYINAREGLVEEVVSFQIFGRWGEPVFSRFGFGANDPTFGWDGTFRSEELNSNVFVYVAVIRLTDGREEVFKGDVSLLK